MKAILGPLTTAVLLIAGSGTALGQQQTAPAPTTDATAPTAQTPAPAPAQATPQTAASAPLPVLPSQAPQYAPVPAEEGPPPATQWTRPYATGQWVFTTEYGWIWVPAGTAATPVEGVPYVYLYTPAYGWTWYISPWGVGPYYYGVWVRHPWHPVGWRGGWVAHPGVVVRLGPGVRGGGTHSAPHGRGGGGHRR